jgi:membrane protein
MTYLLKKRIDGLKAFVWDDDLRSLHGLHRVAVFVLRVIHMLLRELLGGQLNLRAMSLVYTTLLSIVPLLAVSFSVLKGFGFHQRLESYLFEIMLEPLGPSGAEVAETIIGFVENVKVGMLGSVGFAFLIYTVIALVQKIESAFNFVWQIERLRSMSQRFSNYLSVITIGPVLIFSAVGFTATVLNTEMALWLSSVEPFGTLMVYISKLVPYLLVCLAFTFIYILIPRGAGGRCAGRGAVEDYRLGVCHLHCLVCEVCSDLFQLCHPDPAADLDVSQLVDPAGRLADCLFCAKPEIHDAAPGAICAQQPAA